MNKNTLLLIIGLSFLAVLLGWNYVKQPFAQLSQISQVNLPSPAPAPLISDALAQDVQNLIVKMTPEQKIAQLMAAPITLGNQPVSPEWREWLAHRQPGMITVFGSEVNLVIATQALADLQQLTHTATDAAQVPVLFAVDHEGGKVQRLSGEGFTTLPDWQALCALPASQSAAVLTKSANELKQAGISIVFAPVADVATRPVLFPNRICSDQPDKVVAANRQAIGIYTAQGILPVVKHFPGIGQVTVDLHTSFASVTVTPAEASVFHQILSVYPKVGVMVSHVGVENQFKDIPCSLSTACVQELAQSYPEVLIFSDALEMTSARHVATGAPKPLDQIAREAIAAGNDVLVWGPIKDPAVLEVVTEHLATEYTQNPSFKVRVDASLRKVLMYKLMQKI